jgi:hypothetical protein
VLRPPVETTNLKAIAATALLNLSQGSLDEFLLGDLSDPGSTQRRWAIIFRPVALCVSSSEKTAKQGGLLFLHV